MPPALSLRVGGMAVITPAELSATYLRDVPLVDDKGRVMPPEVMATHITAAERAFERRHAVSLSRVTVRMGDLPMSGEPFETPDEPRVRFDARPFTPQDFEGDRHASIKLPLGPLRESGDVLAVGLKLPGRPSAYVWGKDWVQPVCEDLTVMIFPQGAIYAPMPFTLTGWSIAALAGGRLIPNAWQVAYRAGYTADDLAPTGRHADVRNAVAMLAAIAVLVPGSVDQYVAMGVTGLSASVDGLSNSTQLVAGKDALKYAALVKAYADGVAAWESTYANRKGIRAWVW